MADTRLFESEQIDQIATALSAAQGEFPTIAKNKTAKIVGPKGNYSYKYADISDILKAILPITSKHKLAIVQRTEIDGGGLFLWTRIVHASGQWLGCEYPIGQIGLHQSMGAGLTYGRRYSLAALLGIATDEDLDAQAETRGRAKPVVPGAELPEPPPVDDVNEASASSAANDVDAMDAQIDLEDKITEAGLSATAKSYADWFGRTRNRNELEEAVAIAGKDKNVAAEKDALRPFIKQNLARIKAGIMPGPEAYVGGIIPGSRPTVPPVEQAAAVPASAPSQPPAEPMADLPTSGQNDGGATTASIPGVKNGKITVYKSFKGYVSRLYQDAGTADEVSAIYAAVVDPLIGEWSPEIHRTDMEMLRDFHLERTAPP